MADRSLSLSSAARSERGAATHGQRLSPDSGPNAREDVGMRKAAWTLGLVLGLYLVARAIVELFVIDMSDPASYQDDWGGPSLLGVLLVHVGPGLLAGVAITLALVRRRSADRRNEAR
jgi:hypothetical protein